MGQKQLEGEQAAMGSSCQSILPVADKSCSEASTPVKKLHIHASQHLDANFVTPTPEKTEETLNIRCKKEPAKLPEKYGTLSEFFDRMTTSLRLLNLHKQLPTFQNICRQVETLTKRKFSYRHLAQIKFIFPEAVQADKILLHNKKTLSMEPELKVTLLFDVIEGHIEHSPYIALCHTFFHRLIKFVNTHPEGCDVPEAELPEPFNQRDITISANSLPVDSSVETLPNIDEAELLNPSHLQPSFSRHFSRKDEESIKTELSPTSVSPSSITSDTTNDRKIGYSSCSDPVKHDKALQVANEETPMKPPLVLAEVTTETPDLSTPKRSVPTENKIKSVISQKGMASNLFAKRSLDFSTADDEGEFLDEKTTCAKKVEDRTSKNDSIAQSGLKVHQDTSSCLSDLVETIHNIFCSAQWSSITKGELVHKVLVNNFDIIESAGEIEEQIELLVNKVPDWISKKVDPCGDFLYNINKGSDLKSITEKLT
ncbi:CDT1-like protein a, chloroplastic isoform X1 [Cynara cardunculus var. scolymus]|uniref:CDT1-like protein a, chloroplastic isoform X1 n=1 Tax=Cynara cardunculus var. scolymus TaxID=59895 RepID=UPI000D62C38F|nr:CDT1-like protein a, chloroplastic isoform X1 [Cynara cardunculus var. scolymus]